MSVDKFIEVAGDVTDGIVAVTVAVVATGAEIVVVGAVG